MSNHTNELKAGLSHIAELFDLGADAPINHLQAIVGVKEERDKLKVNNSKQKKEITRLKNLLVKSNREKDKLTEENEKLTLEFQDYKFEANKKEDRLVVFNQQLGKSCEELKKKSSNQLVKRIASHKKEVEDLQDRLAKQSKVSDDFHTSCCENCVDLEYICKQIKKGKQRKTVGDPNVEEYPEYRDFLPFLYEIRNILQEQEEAFENKFQQGYDDGREEYQVDQEFLDEKDEEIEKLKKENEKLKERQSIMGAAASSHIQDINETYGMYGDICRKKDEEIEKLKKAKDSCEELAQATIKTLKEERKNGTCGQVIKNSKDLNENLKEEIEKLKETIASRDKYVKLIHQLSRNFHKERCGDNITLEYIKEEIDKGQNNNPEYHEFMTFFYYIKDMLEEADKKEEGTQAIIIKLKEEIDKTRKIIHKMQGRTS